MTHRHHQGREYDDEDYGPGMKQGGGARPPYRGVTGGGRVAGLAVMAALRWWGGAGVERRART